MCAALTRCGCVFLAEKRTAVISCYFAMCMQAVIAWTDVVIAAGTTPIVVSFDRLHKVASHCREFMPATYAWHAVVFVSGLHTVASFD